MISDGYLEDGWNDIMFCIIIKPVRGLCHHVSSIKLFYSPQKANICSITKFFHSVSDSQSISGVDQVQPQMEILLEASSKDAAP